MSGAKIAKRQKISHGSEGPSAPPQSKAKQVEEELASASSSDGEDSDNEQAEAAVEEVPKTFKDLVRQSSVIAHTSGI